MLQISSAASGEVIATLDAAEFGLLAETRGSTVKVAVAGIRGRFWMVVGLWCHQKSGFQAGYKLATNIYLIYFGHLYDLPPLKNWRSWNLSFSWSLGFRGRRWSNIWRVACNVRASASGSFAMPNCCQTKISLLAELIGGLFSHILEIIIPTD